MVSANLKSKPSRPKIMGPTVAFRQLYAERGLIFRLTRREIESRFRGSYLGALWVIINPVLMLAVYTFVFTAVFKARWHGGTETKGEFALHIFSGLLTFGLFAEVVARAPSLIIENTSYVKKVVFPLEVLDCVIVGAALFNAACGFLIFFCFYLIVFGLPPITALLLPLMLAPLLFFTLGVCWVLSSLGVYVRDIKYVVGIFVSMLMFLSPIFYPVSAFPENIRYVMMLNPMAPVLESVDSVLFRGGLPNPWMFTIGLIISLGIAWLGHCFFTVTRRGFADVI